MVMFLLFIETAFRINFASSYGKARFTSRGPLGTFQFAQK